MTATANIGAVNRVAIIGVIALLVPNAAAAQPPADADKFFEGKVRPILLEHCYSCHSAKTEKSKGGLRLDTREAVRTGGDSGPAVVPGKPDDSPLVKAVRYADADLQMPPKGKLSADVIAVLEEWVRVGAPDPRDAKTEATRPAVDPKLVARHWAFQPIRHAALPKATATDWPNGRVDRFVLARLERAGLTPSEDADRYTWLRRVSLDLTGLPPTPAEIESFLQDATPKAHEKVVDRLLASPAFGERWARHWLDLVGYADQIGSTNRVPAVHAWKFRDYVIGSFNADKPFDRFVREQLAGDLLPGGTDAERRDRLIATGFLVLGHLSIAEGDKVKLKWDIVDSQIEKLGTAFLGLTLNCARCHDHKFDPVTHSEYHALAGIFGSTESTVRMGRGSWSTPVVHELPESSPERAAREATLKDHDALVAKFLADKPANLIQRQAHLDFLRPDKAWGYGVRENKSIADARIAIRGNPHALGASVPRGFITIAGSGGSIPADQSGRLQLADWLVAPANPLTARVAVNRIWAKLFGRGLVPSVDYFGLRGESPSHPELLDDLAVRFREGGWSQKKVIRELVLSRTYRMSTIGNAPARRADPDNRLLARMSPRRLEAEAVRDACFAVSGELLVGSGGPPLPLEYFENFIAPANTATPFAFAPRKFRPEQSRVRTIYLPVLRSTAQVGPAEVLNAFDFPQPAQFVGFRSATTVPPQTLFLMNGPLLADRAAVVATDILKSSDDDATRVRALYLRVVNRPAGDAEVRDVIDFLNSFGMSNAERRAGWEKLCQALLMSNEFLFRP